MKGADDVCQEKHRLAQVAVHRIFCGQNVSPSRFRIEQHGCKQRLHVAPDGVAKGRAAGWRWKRSTGECVGYARYIRRAGIACDEVLDHAPRDERWQVRVQEDGIQRTLQVLLGGLPGRQCRAQNCLGGHVMIAIASHHGAAAVGGIVKTLSTVCWTGERPTRKRARQCLNVSLTVRRNECAVLELGCAVRIQQVGSDGEKLHQLACIVFVSVYAIGQIWFGIVHHV